MCGLFYSLSQVFIYNNIVELRSLVSTDCEQLLMIANTLPGLYIVISNFLILQRNFLLIQSCAMHFKNLDAGYRTLL